MLAFRSIALKLSERLRSFCSIIGIFSNDHMPYDCLRNSSDQGQPSLTEMTYASLKVLENDNDKGFFLLVKQAEISGSIFFLYKTDWKKLFWKVEGGRI